MPSPITHRGTAAPSVRTSTFHPTLIPASTIHVRYRRQPLGAESRDLGRDGGIASQLTRGSARQTAPSSSSRAGPWFLSQTLWRRMMEAPLSPASNQHPMVGDD